MVSQFITLMVKILLHQWLEIYNIYGWFLLHFWLVLHLWLIITFIGDTRVTRNFHIAVVQQ